MKTQNERLKIAVQLMTATLSAYLDRDHAEERARQICQILTLDREENPRSAIWELLEAVDLNSRGLAVTDVFRNWNESARLLRGRERV